MEHLLLSCRIVHKVTYSQVATSTSSLGQRFANLVRNIVRGIGSIAALDVHMNGILLELDSHGAQRSDVSDNDPHSVILVVSLHWGLTCCRVSGYRRVTGRGRQELS